MNISFLTGNNVQCIYEESILAVKETPCSGRDIPNTTEKAISLMMDQKIKVVFY